MPTGAVTLYGRTNKKFEFYVDERTLLHKSSLFILINGRPRAFACTAALVAQLAEHVLGKDEVTGSNPVKGSGILSRKTAFRKSKHLTTHLDG